MRRIILIFSIIFLALCFCACGENEEDWRDRYEVRDTATVVAELKEHFAENREELEQIALAMFRDTENTEKYPYGLFGSWGKLYTWDSSMDVDFSNPLESETADLIAAYYAKGFSEAQHIYIDKDLYYVRQEVCVFSYNAFLEDDGVLTKVNLLYCEEEKLEEEKPFGFPPVQIISLDDHWSICVVDYPY